jgi:hypothetical protein
MTNQPSITHEHEIQQACVLPSKEY